MEILSVELNVFVISIIFASLAFILYIHCSKGYFNPNDLDKFVVIDLIRLLKTTCPIQFSNKWRLISNTSSSTRLWYKTLLFPGFKNYINLYGATCAVTCSSLYAFSLISDVSKWGEWEPSSSSAQNLTLQPFTNTELKKDHFMLADQIAGIQRGTDIQSYVAMYRFMSFPEKCSKWILFWNVKKFEFLFFLIQPVTSKNAENQCVITHLYATCLLSSHSSGLVAQRIRNIKEFLYLSQLDVPSFKPSKSSSLLNSVKDSTKSDTLKNESSSSLFSDVRSCDSISNSVFMLVPALHSQRYLFRRFKGFDLILKKVIMKSRPKKSNVKINNDKKENTPRPLRRTTSDFSISSRQPADFYGSSMKINFPNTHKSNTSEPKSDLNRLTKSLDNAISEDGDILVEHQTDSPNQTNQVKDTVFRPKLRSSSEPGIISLERSKSTFDIPVEREMEKSLESISELEESRNTVCSENNEIICSSTSDYEVIDSTNQQFIDIAIAGYLTQGNYGASVLQTEMLLASQFDKTIFTGNRIAGGWIHTSTYKGIPVLTKSISGKIMKISSFLCQMEVFVDCQKVWKFVKNPRFRFFCDESAKTVQILDKISDTQKLVHTYHESTGVIKKEAIDFCLLQTEREEKNNFYSVFQSIESEKCPFMESVTRGSLKPSGWVIQNIAPKSCKVTYLVQIFVSSPDSLFIQELNYIVPQTLHYLKQYFLSEPK